MTLASLAQVSAALAATRSRTEKVRLLAECLRALAPDERETAVAWLSGLLPQGKLGLGPAMVYDLRGIEPARVPTLTIADAEGRLDDAADDHGKRLRAAAQTSARGALRARIGTRAELHLGPAAR